MSIQSWNFLKDIVFIKKVRKKRFKLMKIILVEPNDSLQFTFMLIWILMRHV